jgi:nickel-dependent lactate racemase
MSTAIELAVGTDVWPLAVDPAALVPVRRQPVPVGPPRPPRELVAAALEQPLGFEPLRRALTPDDRVAVAVDPTLPHLGELLAGLLDHLASAGVRPENVTLVTPPGEASADWLDDLPDEYGDVRTEAHDPADRKKLAYLASTKAGRRVYLNRTVVEADFVAVLSGRRFDPLFGYAGAEATLFPALSDEEARAALRGRFRLDPPAAPPVRAEAGEVAWLLGTPFLVQVIEGANGTIQEVVAGLPGTTADGVRRQDARWRGVAAGPADTVIAAISGPADRVTFADVAAAAATAARVVEGDGRIVVLSPAVPTAGEGVAVLRRADDPAEAAAVLAKQAPDDAAAFLWATAAGRGHLFLAGGESDEVAEELFATPIGSPAEVQRLAAASRRLLVIPDAHRTLLTTE